MVHEVQQGHKDTHLPLWHAPSAAPARSHASCAHPLLQAARFTATPATAGIYVCLLSSADPTSCTPRSSSGLLPASMGIPRCCILRRRLSGILHGSSQQQQPQEPLRSPLTEAIFISAAFAAFNPCLLCPEGALLRLVLLRLLLQLFL